MEQHKELDVNIQISPNGSSAISKSNRPTCGAIDKWAAPKVPVAYHQKH